jgi:uncharacterized OB-fold protein
LTDTSAAERHSAPCSNRDYDFFYDGLERGELLIQRCRSCGELRNPPSPICPFCRSFDWVAEARSGKGSIYSYIVHHYPPLPGFETPHPVAVVALEEGIRFTGAMDGTPPDALAIDLPVEAEFLRRCNVASVRFVLSRDEK